MLFRDLAAKFNLTYVPFGDVMHSAGNVSSSETWPSKGRLILTAPSYLNPAPITPIRDNPAWDLLSGTIKVTYRAHRLKDGGVSDDIVVAPGMPTGNTGRVLYWLYDTNLHAFFYSSRYAPLLGALSEYLSVHA
jgi:Gly-Xaa carboxypeptidase